MGKKRSKAEYGFLGGHFPFRQQDGFFINQNNEILFWPTQDAVGYVLDQKRARKIGKIIERESRVKFFFAFTLIGFLVLIVSLLLSYVLHFFTSSIASSPLLFALFFSLGLMAVHRKRIVITRRLKNPNVVADIQALLTACNTVQLRQPAIDPWLLMGVKSHWIVFSLSISIFLLSLSAIVLVHTTSRLMLGDVIIVSTIGVCLILPAWRFMRHYYAFKKCRSEYWQYAHRSWRVKRIEPKLTATLFPDDFLFEWQLFFFLTTFPLLLPVSLYQELHHPIITSNDILTIYEPAVYGNGNPSFRDRNVAKWEGKLSAYISSAELDYYSLQLKRKMQQLATIAGVKLELTDDPEKTVDLKINFVDHHLYTKERNHISWDMTAKRNDGRMGNVKIDISLISWYNLVGTNKFYDSTDMEQAAPRLVNEVAMVAFGFLPNQPPPLAPQFTSQNFEEIDLSELLVALHYDRAVKFQGNRQQVLPAISEMANEISNANSFRDWLYYRRGIVVEHEVDGLILYRLGRLFD